MYRSHQDRFHRSYRDRNIEKWWNSISFKNHHIWPPTIMQLTWPFMAAKWMLVYPVGVSSFKSTPFTDNHLTRSKWPNALHMWIGTQPRSSAFTLSSGTRLMSSFNRSISPVSQAWWIVGPLWFTKIIH